MRFTLVFFFLQFTSLLFAQNHVTWSFTYDYMNSNIVITGTIDEGWHLYSQKTRANSGPIPVTVDINKKKGLKLIPLDDSNFLCPVTNEKYSLSNGILSAMANK